MLNPNSKLRISSEEALNHHIFPEDLKMRFPISKKTPQNFDFDNSDHSEKQTVEDLDDEIRYYHQDFLKQK